MSSFITNALTASLLMAASAAAADPIPLGNRLELFIDDALIDRFSGDVVQYVHEPRAEEVVLVTDRPWEGNTCAYYTIFQDGNRYRMYYRGSHADEQTQKPQHPEVVCYAESTDGIHWTRPELGLCEWEGSTANNIVWNGLGSHCFTPFKDANPDATAETRYKAITAAQSPSKKGLYVLGSADGLRWSLLSDEPVITEGAFDSQNLAFWDPHTRQYVDYHRTFVDRVRTIMTCTSADFLHWTEPELLQFPAAPNEHLYTNAIRPYPRAPHLRVGFPTRYQPANSQVEPIVMVSRDGVTFHRHGKAVIPITAPKERDGNRSNYMANALVSLPGNDREYAVYASESYYDGPDSRLRRFMYRVDGFVSARAGLSGGEVVTRPFTYDGTTLVLNYAVHDGGSVRVELQAADGRPLAPFALDNCRALTGDEINGTAMWESGGMLSDHTGEPVRLRFVLQNADLYSFRFADP
ncbi:MAG: hypothetical protein KDA75_05105 [Planctomycetaceae bacterium]|nr:hypothetical protein [Planctomycetaceae bacterium]